MKSIDLNSDLGEGFGDYVMADDAALLEIVSSANVACGFHAGDPVTMHAAARLAVARGVCIGAHIGYPDRQGFGRRHIAYEPKELELMTLYQLGALRAIVESVGGRLTHANFHGALGNLSFVDYEVAATVLRAVRTFDRGLKFVALPFTEAFKAAQDLGIETVTSFLADRAYTREGLLVSRKQPGAVIHDPEAIRERVRRVLAEGRIETVDGASLEMQVDSILVHGDTAGALDIARGIREAAIEAGYQIRPFAS
jgi:UPF0271 protein